MSQPRDFQINDTEVIKQILPSKLRILYPLRTGEEPDPPNADIPHGWGKQLDAGCSPYRYEIPIRASINGEAVSG